jgi:hypothetical protein
MLRSTKISFKYFSVTSPLRGGKGGVIIAKKKDKKTKITPPPPPLKGEELWYRNVQTFVILIIFLNHGYNKAKRKFLLWSI